MSTLAIQILRKRLKQVNRLSQPFKAMPEQTPKLSLKKSMARLAQDYQQEAHPLTLRLKGVQS